MRKETVLFICGALILLMPFLGVPLDWKEVALYVLGALVMFFALICRLERRRRERRNEDAAYEEFDPRAAPGTYTVPDGYEAYDEETQQG